MAPCSCISPVSAAPIQMKPDVRAMFNEGPQCSLSFQPPASRPDCPPTHRRVCSESELSNRRSNSAIEESAALALEDIRQCERSNFMAMGAIITHIAEHPQPHHKNWRSLIQRALTNVISARTPCGRKLPIMQVFAKAWMKLLRQGIQTDMIRFTPEEIASAMQSASKYSDHQGIEEVAREVLSGAGHPWPENDQDLFASTASTVQEE